MAFGRADLVNRLGRNGLPRRQAVQLVNAVFEAVIRGLARGENVDLHCGTLSIKHRKQRRSPDRPPRERTATRKRSPIVFTVSEDLDRILNPLPEARRTITLPPRPVPKQKVEPGIRLNVTMKKLRKPVKAPEPIEIRSPAKKLTLRKRTLFPS